MPRLIISNTAPVVLAGALAGALAGFLLRYGGDASVAAKAGNPAAFMSDAATSPLGKRRLLPQTAARLEAMRRAGAPSRQIAAALALADMSSPAEIRDLLEHSHEFPDNSAEEVAIGTLLKRWLELEPLTALEFCRSRQPAFLARLLGQWSQSQPEKAAVWVKAMPPGGSKDYAWVELCKTAGLRDPAKAWEMLGETPGLDVNNGTWQINSIVKRMVEQDLEKALAGLAAMPPTVMAAARKAIAARLTETDPASGWEWARTQPNPAETMGAALAASLGSDSSRSLEMLKSLSIRELGEVFEQSAYEWRLKNLPDLTARLTADATLEPSAKEAIANGLFGRAAWSDPAEAAALWPLLSADTQRERIADYVKHWSREDSAAAKAWVESLPLGDLRSSALTARAAFESPEKAADRASPAGLVEDFQQDQYIRADDPRIAGLNKEQLGTLLGAVGEGRHYRAREILLGLGEANPQLAASWLEGATLDSTTGPMAARFSASWAGNDPAAAAAWVKALPPDSHLARVAARNVAGQYARYAPEQAEAWIGTLPAGPVQDAARAGVEKP